MPLMTGKTKLTADSRSRIGSLQIGEHESPSEDWIVDPTLPKVLDNPYGGHGMTEVIIPMGRLVAVAEPIQVYTGKFKTSLTIADGTNPVIGVAPFNYVREGAAAYNDKWGGNKPAIITNKYIRLPYIPANADSALCPWGHVVGDNITIGDFLKPTANGQFTKWVEGVDSIHQCVGQILAKDFNQEMVGWLKMAMWAEQAKREDNALDDFYGTSATGPNTPPGYGQPYNGDYRKGTKNLENMGYMNNQQLQFTGIPGLTDGAGRSLTRFAGKSLGAIPGGAADGDTMLLQIKDETGSNNATDVVKSTDNSKKFVLKVGGVAVTEGTANGEYQINYKTGAITYKALAADAGNAVTADYCLFFYGTPTYIDFKGAIGVFNVLLKL
jgi:hypothetical protein